MASANKAELVSALRNIQLQPELQGHSLNQARNNLQQQIDSRGANYWQMSNEIDWLFAKLLAEDATSAMRYRDLAATQADAKPDDTVLQRTRRLWARIFPGRKISFDSYSPVVASEYSGAGSTYTADRMSDGERVALYLAGRVLNARSAILIVDEPELYFHSRLAVRFWDELEQERPDVRFVYITHDLPFGLSRVGAQFILLQPSTGPVILSVDDQLPEAVASAILGAASFSIYARRIVFCEGTEGSTGDVTLYRAWFNDRLTAVIPVGSHRDVLRCAQSFGSSKLVAGVTCIGIIDRDYWPDTVLGALDAHINPLKVHEIENLYVIRGVFVATAEHFANTPDHANTMYDELLLDLRTHLLDSLVTKQIAERCKTRLEPILQQGLNSLKGAASLTAFEAAALQQLDPATWSVDFTTVYNEEKDRVLAAAKGNEGDLLRIFPGKPFLPIAANKLGMTPLKYKKLIEDALISPDPAMQQFRTALETALLPYLPPRKHV